MTRGGGVAENGTEYAFDIAVLATGFDAEAALGDIVVTGRHGRTLSEEWADGPQSYLGILVKGFPNLFLMDGPNAAVTSIMDLLEAQSYYIASALKMIEQSGAATLEVTRVAQDSFTAMVDARVGDSMLTKGGCSSWYRVNGTGRVFTHWPGPSSELEAMLRHIRVGDLSFSGKSSVPSALASSHLGPRNQN